jgi:hypothetical protein
MLSRERGAVEAPPGWNAETDRVREGISEGIHLVEFGWVVPRGTEAVSLWLFDTCAFESTGSLEARACR